MKLSRVLSLIHSLDLILIGLLISQCPSVESSNQTSKISFAEEHEEDIVLTTSTVSRKNESSSERRYVGNKLGIYPVKYKDEEVDTKDEEVDVKVDFTKEGPKEFEVRSALKYAEGYVKHWERRTIKLKKLNLAEDRKTKLFYTDWSTKGAILVEATKKLAEIYPLEVLEKYEPHSKGSKLLKYCPLPVQCEKKRTSKYRTLDGTCNNLLFSNWGKSYSPFYRILPPDYADGIDEPRVSKSGSPLPSARKVSYYLTSVGDKVNHALSNLFVQFTQFVNHDMQGTVLGSDKVDCCNPELDKYPERNHPQCYSIPVTPEDPFYSKFNITCLPMSRTVPGPREGCRLGPREQINGVTAFIDGSMIYGPDEETAHSLRTFIGGKLIHSITAGVDFLPFDEDEVNECSIPDDQRHEKGLTCFLAGDFRVNQQVGLTIMQGVWLREHNRLAEHLSKLNPHWSDEKLYQEARRVVIAEIQHITFKEMLPIIIGSDLMDTYGLKPLKKGYFEGYDEYLNPNVLADFATAAFRLHPYIAGMMDMKGFYEESALHLSDTFNNPSELYSFGSHDALIHGMVKQGCHKFGTEISDQINQKLFKPPKGEFGSDLIAVDIQRGRDHGIPSYTAWRKACGLTVPKSFKDLESLIDSKVAKKAADIYEHVDDVDLFIAGIAEKPMDKIVIGPTFACIITHMFVKFKKADRYFYENSCEKMKSKGGCFTESQLNEIRKVTLAEVLCKNTNLVSVQEHSLFKPASNNPKKPCSELMRMDLSQWSEEKPCDKKEEHVHYFDQDEYLVYQP